MKKYLTKANLIIGLFVLGITILTVVVFFPKNKPDESLRMLKDLQKQNEQLIQQLQKNDVENKKRDSQLIEDFHRNNWQREFQLSKTKQTANEKINHINSPSFNNDSIRRAFAN